MMMGFGTVISVIGDVVRSASSDGVIRKGYNIKSCVWVHNKFIIRK
jgi:hypothetical protein